MKVERHDALGLASGIGRLERNRLARLARAAVEQRDCRERVLAFELGMDCDGAAGAASRPVGGKRTGEAHAALDADVDVAAGDAGSLCRRRGGDRRRLADRGKIASREPGRVEDHRGRRADGHADQPAVDGADGRRVAALARCSRRKSGDGPESREGEPQAEAGECALVQIARPVDDRSAEQVRPRAEADERAAKAPGENAVARGGPHAEAKSRRSHRAQVDEPDPARQFAGRLLRIDDGCREHDGERKHHDGPRFYILPISNAG